MQIETKKYSKFNLTYSSKAIYLRNSNCYKWGILAA